VHPGQIGGGRQGCPRVGRGIEQGAVGILPILIGVAEHELAESHQIAIFGLGIGRRVTLAGPVDLGLADAVPEAEGLYPTHIRGR